MPQVGFGIIGAGLWGHAHADVYSGHRESSLVAICDTDRSKAEKMAGEFGVEKVYTDYNEMLEDDEVEAVAITTPDFAHAGPVCAAAEAGKHFIVEKPLATTDEDLLRIEKALEGSTRHMMVDYHNRWNPPIAVLKNSVDAGEFGEIVSGYFRLNDVIRVPLQMLSWASQSSILWFLGTHAVDTFRFLLEDEVKRVYSVSREVVLAEKGLDVSDGFQTILEFSRGAVATIENNWIVPDTHPFINDFKLNLLGSKSMVNVDLSSNNLIERFTPSDCDHPDVLIQPTIFGKKAGFSYESIRDFVDCLVDDRKPRVGLTDGVRVSRVILAIMESARTRTPVDVEYEM